MTAEKLSLLELWIKTSGVTLAMGVPRELVNSGIIIASQLIKDTPDNHKIWSIDEMERFNLLANMVGAELLREQDNEK